MLNCINIEKWIIILCFGKHSPKVLHMYTQGKIAKRKYHLYSINYKYVLQDQNISLYVSIWCTAPGLWQELGCGGTGNT